ncbi:MAG: protein translocase subunit SecF, partial [Anaerotignum sp.]|nr:protein translocase subunit SecF [Anaerotignum sp.]
MNVIENRKKFFILSLLIILIGFGAMFANYKAGNGIFNWDVEFTGGTSMEIELGEAYDVTELEEIIREVTGQTSPQIQQILGTNGVRIRMQSVDSQT